ncbi:VWA domain-containing protein [Coleofasciculus sp. FACHB-712]|uniref:VWA domain-containing protein n=1 Tax=Coleofasciculus sp. FACHB-712 TaxID=2692789 RepID=UPI001683B83F|nr:VWA domain-containing protein [Coleofasciculus sp. FACHB-712]MBD1945543.1 VWA domain-containing protein [Coleofasciculus sp. FACHB-712]
MDATQPAILNIIVHLRSCNEPFLLRYNGQPPRWSDESLHREAYEQNPELYALLALITHVTKGQRLRILFQLLQRSRVGMSKEVRQTSDRVINFLLAILHPDQVLTVFLALRRVRANHKHTARAILQYILNHPQFEDMALRRRPAVVDAIEHALGKNVARGSVKKLSDATVDKSDLRRYLLRYAHHPESVKAILPFLYHSPLGTGLMPAEGEVKYTLVHQQYRQFEVQTERPKTVTATNRGDISATLVHLYRGGKSPELMSALQHYVEQAVVNLPKFSGQVALVLDASASTRSYGDREYCSLAQSIALKLVLEKCCANLKVHTLGGVGELPMPEGYTDLAGTLLDALEDSPDLVAIVSDGYENMYPGDLERVVATLPQLGIHTPIIFCHSKFTALDDLELRRPAANLLQREFWHQDDFEDLLNSLFAIALPRSLRIAGAKQTETSLQEFLRQKLTFQEKELATWTTSH